MKEIKIPKHSKDDILFAVGFRNGRRIEKAKFADQKRWLPIKKFIKRYFKSAP